MEWLRRYRIEVVEEQPLTMNTSKVAGFWTGKIYGMNHGGLTLEIQQEADKISGIARIHEPAIGQYEYRIEGRLTDSLSFKLHPVREHLGINLGVVQVVCALEEENKLSGRWKSTNGMQGAFDACRYPAEKLGAMMPQTNSVFIVHGHDEGAKHAVARFLETIGLEPVILQEQISKGMTVLEKFEQFAGRCGFAVVLMTPDDFGYPAGKEEEKKHRPRQNVILELGYFAAKLGRSKTLVLVKGDLEMPSDLLSLVYEPMDKNEGWKMRLAKELSAAKFKVNLNAVLTA